MTEYNEKLQELKKAQEKKDFGEVLRLSNELKQITPAEGDERE
ncbi:restriction endonuclease S subunit [Geomicrobium halophilum]|uniref:Restriction endonuclease S subunit n=1 Tax=Geomicrobium halophilum TaxID=549000 RepID=A0A841PLG6_9BACL|nr:hypothetical protein [Geomicrobium halophilum]MBB6449599.1 restriction endonuclease S subunit [Geomicrobium halophilum]